MKTLAHKPIYLLVLMMFSLVSYGQLSLHFGATDGEASGLHMAPYEHPQPFLFAETTALFGGELGYRFSKRIELRTFYYTGKVDKSGFLDYSAGSIYAIYGLKPQINVFSWKDGLFNIDMALPFSKVSEKIEWSETTWGIFSSSDSASGQDKATFFRVTVAPTFRLQLKKPRLIFELGFDFSFDSLTSSHRTIYYNSISSDYDNPDPIYPHQFLAAHLSVGYSFW